MLRIANDFFQRNMTEPLINTSKSFIPFLYCSSNRIAMFPVPCREIFKNWSYSNAYFSGYSAIGCCNAVESDACNVHKEFAFGARTVEFHKKN